MSLPLTRPVTKRAMSSAVLTMAPAAPPWVAFQMVMLASSPPGGV